MNRYRRITVNKKSLFNPKASSGYLYQITHVKEGVIQDSMDAPFIKMVAEYVVFAETRLGIISIIIVSLYISVGQQIDLK
jgi:hypothetical protein